jgi:hypothetical protein
MRISLGVKWLTFVPEVWLYPGHNDHWSHEMTASTTVYATWEFVTVRRYLDHAGTVYTAEREAWGSDVGGDYFTLRFARPEDAQAFRRDYPELLVPATDLCPRVEARVGKMLPTAANSDAMAGEAAPTGVREAA